MTEQEITLIAEDMIADINGSRFQAGNVAIEKINITKGAPSSRIYDYGEFTNIELHTDTVFAATSIDAQLIESNWGFNNNLVIDIANIESANKITGNKTNTYIFKTRCGSQHSCLIKFNVNIG